MAHHGERVSALVVDATRPAITLGFLAGKAFLVYISNVYDNLPTDEVACIHGRTYQVQTRAFLADDDAERDRRPVRRRAGTGWRRSSTGCCGSGPSCSANPRPSSSPTPARRSRSGRRRGTRSGCANATSRWRAWTATRSAPSLTGEILRPLIEAAGRCPDARQQRRARPASPGTLPLLHPFGRVQCHDLFLTGGQQYRTGFYGPGKYDGSVVNWVNGPLLQLVASRRGFGVEFTPFRQRAGLNITTLTAQARD